MVERSVREQGSSPVGVTKVTYNLTTLYTISSLG